MPGDAEGQEPTASREVPGALAWGLFSKILISILAIGSNVLIVRGLGDHDYGVYSLFLNIARFLSVAIGLGLAHSVLRFLPELRVQRNTRGARQLLSRAFSYQIIAWFAALVVVLLVREWISRVLHTDLGPILLFGTALLILEGFWVVLSNVFLAVRRMRMLTLASVSLRVALVAFLLLVLRAGMSIQTVLMAVAGSFVCGSLLLVPQLRKTLPWLRGREGPGLPTARLMRYALPVALGDLINQVFWRSSETLIIGHYWRPEDVGYFNAAYNLPQMILEFIPLAIWPVVLAALSEVHARRGEDLLRGVQLYFRLIFVLVIPLAVTGMILGGQFYLALYGESMAPGAPICQLFFGVFLLSFLVTPLRMAFWVKERALANMLIATVGAVVNVALDFVWIPRYGIWGAVPPVAIALAVSGVLQYVVSRRILPAIHVPWGKLARVLLGSAVVLPLWLVRTRLEAPLPLLSVLAGATLMQYVVIRALRVLGAEERELLLKSALPMRERLADLFVPKAGR